MLMGITSAVHRSPQTRGGTRSAILRQAQERYTPFGEPRLQTNQMATDKRFTRQVYQAVLGSVYDYNARMYAPLLGRFISPDSIVQAPADPQTLNRYAYTRNNP